MTITWQGATTTVLVLMALGYVAFCLVRFIRRKGSPNCGCCPKCPAQPPEKPLISLDEPPRR